MFVIIPAYEPDEKMIGIINNINKDIESAHIIVVDDGSGSAYESLFRIAEQKGATVLTHYENKGKGSALKTAFAYIQSLGVSDTMVTIDSDGQHLVSDMKKVINRLDNQPNTIVLGIRDFAKDVPLRSRFGNRITATLFKWATGINITDTQTGLRAMSTQLIDWLLSLEGEQFDYEFTMLLDSQKSNVVLVEEPIETIYIEDNKSSHFHPIKDSISVYKPLLKFIGASLLAQVTDATLLLLLMALTNDLLFSVVIARLVSAGVQCFVSAKYVFESHMPSKQVIRRYTLLAVGILMSNYMLMNALVSIGITLMVAKVITEGMLFAVSYYCQKNYVFI